MGQGGRAIVKLRAVRFGLNAVGFRFLDLPFRLRQSVVGLLQRRVRLLELLDLALHLVARHQERFLQRCFLFGVNRRRRQGLPERVLELRDALGLDGDLFG